MFGQAQYLFLFPGEEQLGVLLSHLLSTLWLPRRCLSVPAGAAFHATSLQTCSVAAVVCHVAGRQTRPVVCATATFHVISPRNVQIKTVEPSAWGLAPGTMYLDSGLTQLLSLVLGSCCWYFHFYGLFSWTPAFLF